MTDKPQHFRRYILDSMPVAIVTMDFNFKITSFNRKAEEMTGFPASAAVGRLCSEILRSNKCKNECPLQTVREYQESATGLEAELTNHQGETVPVRIGTTAIEDADGNFIGYLEIIEDISRFKEMEREKENFVSMVAHDMKSPMVIIGGFIKRLQKELIFKDNDKILKYLQTIDEAEHKLESLIHEFLEHSRLESNYFNLKLDDIDIADILKKIIENHRQMIEEQKIDLQCDCQVQAPINADAVYLNRALTNLLNNALKYSPRKGKIIISVREADHEIVIRFQDQGKGIDPKELPYIFDAFYQGKSKNEKSGHGLGLASVKSIVRQHGGRVTVESTPGKGSVFTVRLPRKLNE
ncbi:MAG: PAS domain-containing sensor histidine kinase [Candidatus Sabulitectum sp.]|nr:PAS domain-containing sensor histidine kinase [Candidatus Sabulitectum sp.]